MFFTLFGMETGVITFLVTFALADSIESIRKKEGRVRPMLWFAAALLTRVDVLPVMVLVLAFVIFSVKKGRLRLVVGVFAVALVVSIHLLWRYRFYGDWLPNTYYLKATGWPLAERMRVGIKQTLWTVASFGLPIVFAGLAVMKPKRWHLLILACFSLAVAYQIYVGGDAWALNRFVLPVSLGLAVLAAEGIGNMAAFFVGNRKSPVMERIVLVAMSLLCVLAMNAVHWDHFLLVARPQTTAHSRMNIRYVLAVDKVAELDASVAVSWAGTFPYFSRRLCFDLYGKCDRHIARLAAIPGIRRAGHNKNDLTYSLNTYKPDIIIHAASTINQTFYQDYCPMVTEVDGIEIPFCMRKGTSKVKGGRAVGWRTFSQCLSKIRDEDDKSF